MIINDKDYLLHNDNFVRQNHEKTKIIIGHTFNDGMKHVNGWKTRYNGKYKKTAAVTIDAAGLIYKHFDPKYQSEFFQNKELNSSSIIILLENFGWLYKDIHKNRYITWLGDIYNKPTEVLDKRWRDNRFWDPYTLEQFNSCLSLVSKLCEEFKIQKYVVSHNTKIDFLKNYSGVLYKSNLDKNYTDLNPSWDFENFKIKLEDEEYNKRT